NQALLRNPGVHLTGECSDIGDGHPLNLTLDLAAHGRRYGIRIYGSPDGEFTATVLRLKSVQIERGSDVLANLQIVGVCDYAHDLSDVVISDSDPMPDRIRVAKEHARHRLADDYYSGRLQRIVGTEVPSRNQWNAQRLEIARRDPVHIDVTVRLGTWSAAFHGD